MGAHPRGAGRLRPRLAGIQPQVHRLALDAPGISSDLGDLGRFAEPLLLILVSLSDRPKHGYAIMEDVEAIGGSRIGREPCTPLARLESRGLIEALPPKIADGPID